MYAPNFGLSKNPKRNSTWLLTAPLLQITGVNAIVYYAPVVFQDAGLTPRMAFIMGGVGSIAMLVGTLLPILVSLRPDSLSIVLLLAK